MVFDMANGFGYAPTPPADFGGTVGVDNEDAGAIMYYIMGF